MLSLSHTSSTPTTIIFDTALDDWSTKLSNLCFTEFGAAGQQISSNRAPPLLRKGTISQQLAYCNEVCGTNSYKPLLVRTTYKRSSRLYTV